VRLLAFLEYAAVTIGVIGMIAGWFFHLPKGVELGVVTTGAGIALGGLEGVLTRRMPFRASDDAYESYAGTPALIVGLMALAAGGATIWAGYLLSEGAWHATVSYLMRRPGPLLAAGGLLLIGFGVLMMLNPTGRSGWGWRLLLYFPRLLVGLALVAAGVGGIGLGAWERMDPQAFARLAKTVR
jgi:hypothetical protein